MTANEQQNPHLDLWRRTACGVGAVALIFSLVVGVLLSADWVCAGQAKTVCSTELNQVLLHARQTPDDSTVALAREMDRVARHAYFSGVAFRHAGIGMLVVGLLVARDKKTTG